MKNFILTLLFTVILSSCLSKGTENVTNSKGPEDITISLLKISPPSIVIGVSETTSFEVAGGNEPYTYSISSGYGAIDQEGNYTAPASLGNNTVKVVDAGGNAVYAVVTVGSSLQISPTSKTMGTSENFTLQGVGGVAPYTFSVISGDGTINSSTGVYTSGATPGTATVEIKDTNNDVAYSIITIVDALTVTPSSATVEDGATYAVSVAGGTTPYTYQVYAGSGSIDAAGNYTAPASEGVEIIRITDANTNYVEMTLTIKKGPNLSITDATLAPGQETTISSSEGTAPFTYTLESGLGNVDASTGVFTAPSIASTSIVRCTDANGFFQQISIQTYNLKKVAMGDNFACMLHVKNDNASSDVKCWGYKENGILGDGNSHVGDEASELGDNLPSLDFGTGYGTAIGIYSSYSQHKCAVFSNNKFKCWGEGNVGRLGNGSQSDRGFLDRHMGDYLPEGQLGTGVLVNSTLDVDKRMSLGADFTCVAIDSNNTMKCFGEGAQGRTGNGNQTDYCNSAANCGNNNPEVNLGAGKSLVQVATGAQHSCAIIAPDNKVKCWGEGNQGRLGSGGTADAIASPSARPFLDLGTGRTALQITAGYYHTCALLDNYDVKCWGHNNTGQLGLEIPTNQYKGDQGGEMGDALPAVDLGSVSYPVKIKSKAYHTCAIFNNGDMKCWGRNNYGQLGIGNTSQKGDNAGEMGDNLPFINVGTGESVLSVDVSERHTCVITSTNELKCWGQNSFGQLGNGNTNQIGDNSSEMGDNLVAVNLGTGKTATMVTAANYSTCALLNDGKVKCWGNDEQGSLGIEWSSYGDHSGEAVSARANVDFGTGLYAVDIFAGRNSMCAILNNGETKCFGSGGSGRLGQSNTNTRGDQPSEMGDNLAVTDLGSGLSAVSGDAGNNHTCAVLNSGDIKCWGEGANGRRGSNDQNDRGDGANEMGDNLATVDLGGGRTAKKVVTGENFSCAIMDNDQVKCWGYNGHGRLAQGNTQQLGYNGTWTTGSYGNVNLGTGRSAKDIEAFNNHWCVIMDNDEVKCWGYNNVGQLGYETNQNKGDSAAEIGDSHPSVNLGTGRTAKMLSGGYYHTCALLDNDKIKCWGDAGQGQLGNGSTTRRGDGAGEMGDALPYVILDSNDKPLRIYGGFYFNCAVMESNDIKCWGYNVYGQLGQEHRYNVGTDPLSMGSNLPTTY